MKYLIAFFLVISSLILLVACKTTQDTSDLSKLTTLIQMYKSPCFGKCPTYRLSIYEGGFASFDGQVNTQKLGLYVKQLSKETYQSITEAFEQANFSQYDNNYPSKVSDLPKTTLTYIQGDVKKSVMGDMNLPDPLKKLEKRLEEIANSDGWTLREGKEQVEKSIPSEIIVQFKPDTDIPDWIHGFEDYNAQLIRELGPKTMKWLISFDENKIPADRMLDLIKRSKGVSDAQFNKKIEYRDR